MRKVLIVALLFVALGAGLAWSDGARSGTIYTVGTVAAAAKPVAALADLGAGLVTNGTHSYKFTFVDAGGETLPTPASAVVTTATATNGKVNVTIPAFPAGATGANVYRTVTGDAGNYLLVNAAPIAAAGVYLDNIADGGLGAAAPAVNTTTTPLADPLVAPTVALWNGGAGTCTAGAHLIKVAYTTACNGGTSALSVASDAVTSVPATNGQIAVTTVASVNAAVTGIAIYMTHAAGADYFLAANAANANGTVTLNLADAFLVTAPPTSDTASADTIILPTTGKKIVHLWLRNNHATEKVWTTIDGSTCTTSVTTSDWISAAGGTLEWLVGARWRETTGITAIHLRGETTAPTVTYRISEE